MDRLIRGFAFDGQVRLIGIESTDLVQVALNDAINNAKEAL